MQPNSYPNNPTPGIKNYRTVLWLSVCTPIVITILLIIGVAITHKSKSSSPSFASQVSQQRLQRAPGEELSLPPARRPAQYNHVCEQLSPLTVYITHGSPACFPGDSYIEDYGPDVPGTIYSTPCETTGNANTFRYVYIASNASCPLGTNLVSQTSATPLIEGPN